VCVCTCAVQFAGRNRRGDEDEFNGAPDRFRNTGQPDPYSAGPYAFPKTREEQLKALLLRKSSSQADYERLLDKCNGVNLRVENLGKVDCQQLKNLVNALTTTDTKTKVTFGVRAVCCVVHDRSSDAQSDVEFNQECCDHLGSPAVIDAAWPVFPTVSVTACGVPNDV
jgi:hypothetical protein